MTLCDQFTELWNKANIVELSHVLEDGIPVPWDLSPFHKFLYADPDKGGSCHCYEILMNEHNGTHLDAPIHMIKDGKSIDCMPLESFAFPCSVLDCSEGGADFVESSEILEWERKHGAIRPGEAVFIYTGQENKWMINDPDKEFLTKARGLSADASKLLVSRHVSAVGIDCASIDSTEADSPLAHRILLGNDIPVIENLCNLTRIPNRVFVMAFPLLIKEGSGSPVRVIALF